MEAKEYLEQIMTLQRLIYCMDRKIEYMNDKLYQIGSPSFEPSFNTSRAAESRHATKLMEIDNLRSDRKMFTEMLQRLRQEAQEIIETLNGEDCSIMCYRFLDQRSIRDIANRSCLSKSTVDRRIKTIVQRLQIPLDAFDLEKELQQADLARYFSWL